MAVKIKSVCPISPQDISEWGLKTVPHWLPSTAYYFEAAKTFEVNPLVLVAWAVVRSSKFTSKEYNDNKDIFALGGRYSTYRESIMCGASELTKFENTGMMQEQAEVEKIYADVSAFAAGLPPVVVPPKPPKPPVPTKLPPKEVEPEKSKPGTPMNWKKIAMWVSGVCTALGVVAVLTPTPLDDIVIKAIKVIADLLSNS